MAIGEKTKAAQKAYSAQLKRIRKQIYRMQERGYQFTGKIIPDRPKRITRQSVEKLRKITAGELYKKSVKIQETDSGFQVIKGTEARKAERSASAKKAAQTRKERKKEKILSGQITESDVVLENVYYLIDIAGDDQYEAALDLRRFIDDGIRKYGRDEVARLFQEAGRDAIIAAEKAIEYKVGSPQHTDAIQEISEIMSFGEIPTMEEAQKQYRKRQDSMV